MAAGFGMFGGQRNASFPMRQDPPQSRVVDNPFAGMNGPGAWISDWQNRFNAEAAQARAPETIATPQGFDNAGYLQGHSDVTSPDNWLRDDASAAAFGPASDALGAFHYAGWGQHEGRGSNFDPNAYLQLNPDVAEAISSGIFAEDSPDGPYTSAHDHFARNGWAEGRNVAMNYEEIPGYTPDFTGLNAERDRMQPLAQNQIRQQQSFNMMNGWGQENGVMNDDYTAAGFGQVSNETNPFGPGMGQPAFDISGGNSGISTDWLSGVYDPANQQQSGVFRPQQQNNGFGGWGF
jgi:hypothetical protein